MLTETFQRCRHRRVTVRRRGLALPHCMLRRTRRSRMGRSTSWRTRSTRHAESTMRHPSLNTHPPTRRAHSRSVRTSGRLWDPACQRAPANVTFDGNELRPSNQMSKHRRTGLHSILLIVRQERQPPERRRASSEVVHTVGEVLQRRPRAPRPRNGTRQRIVRHVNIPAWAYVIVMLLKAVTSSTILLLFYLTGEATVH